MIDRSLAAIKENCNVLGIGVAVSVNVSTFTFMPRSFSFAATPNFCSSSITKRPKSLNFIFLLSIACVPIRISTLPDSTSLYICVFSLAVRNLLTYSIVTPNSLSRSEKVL